MALADYYNRGAVAAAQIIAGFDETAFKSALGSTTVGVSLGDNARSAEGRKIADLTVRLLARLYPTLAIQASSNTATLASELADLAARVNPVIDVVDETAEVGIVIGSGRPHGAASVFAGSDGWDSLTSSRAPRPVGRSQNPFGAGASACFAAANLFRLMFAGGADALDTDLRYSTYARLALGANESTGRRKMPRRLPDTSVLIGCGAIGNAVVWSLGHTKVAGDLYLVDPEIVDLGNLQRYVMVERAQVGEPKPQHLAQAFGATGIHFVPHQQSWAEFVETSDYQWGRALVAVDSAQGRREVQASLPQRVLNAWTQPGDLGVAEHGTFGGGGACLSCLYLPEGTVPNEDELVARALGIPEHALAIRNLLYLDSPLPADILDLVAERLSISRELLEPYATRPVRALYVEGFCGGAVLPLDRINGDDRATHVPLAHQSALAGVQLAAAFCRACTSGGDDQTTSVTRIDLMRPLGAYSTQIARRTDSRCICADPDYVGRYHEKYTAEAFSALA